MAEETRQREQGRFPRGLGRFTSTRPGGWLAINVANRVDRVLLPLTRGRFSTAGPRATIGRLETTGARSGRRRRMPLLYLAEGENIVLVASKAGNPKHPAWYHNLKAHPDVTFLSRRGKRDYVAREADGAERERLWAEVNRVYPGYDTYQGRAPARRIPVIVLEPKS